MWNTLDDDKLLKSTMWDKIDKFTTSEQDLGLENKDYSLSTCLIWQISKDVKNDERWTKRQRDLKLNSSKTRTVLLTQLQLQDSLIYWHKQTAHRGTEIFFIYDILDF